MPLTEKQQILFEAYQRIAAKYGLVLEQFETAKSKRLKQGKVYGFACYPKRDAHKVETFQECVAAGYHFQGLVAVRAFIAKHEKEKSHAVNT